MLGDVPGQPHPRSSPYVGDDLDVAVDVLAQDGPLREPGAGPGLDHRFLRGPSCGQVTCRRRTLVGGVATLTRRKGFGEHRSRLVNLVGEIRNGDEIDPHADNAHGWPG